MFPPKKQDPVSEIYSTLDGLAGLIRKVVTNHG